MPSAEEDLTLDEPHAPRARTRRVRRALVVGVGVVALFAGSTADTAESASASQPQQDSDTGGDTGGGDTGSGDTGGSDTGGGDGGSTEPPPAPAPAPDSDDGLTTEEWVLLILLGIAAVAIIVAATAAASSHSDRREAQRRDMNRRLREITSGCRWVNDQATLSVLQATTSEQLTYAWTTTRSHMLDLESKIAAASAATGDGNLAQSLSYLGQSLAGLRGALESNVQLRQRPDAAAQTDLLAASAQTVSNRRQQVESAMVPVMAVQQ